jgi:mono/diheme cytochrome c family protein
MKRGLLIALLLLAGCEKIARNMYDQPRYKPMHESALFADGTSARSPPPGSVPAAGGALAGASSGRLGAALEEERSRLDQAKRNPLPVTLALLRRGRERFDIYCAPCHSPVGDGDGMVVRRGFPPPPSFHVARLRDAPERHFYDVMTHGYGIMLPYADRVAPEDRWAIVAYIRALQLSQYARAEDLR